MTVIESNIIHMGDQEHRYLFALHDTNAYVVFIDTAIAYCSRRREEAHAYYRGAMSLARMADLAGAKVYIVSQSKS